MSILIENRPITCIYCGYDPVIGKIRDFKDNRSGKTIRECTWTCPKCLHLVRHDEVDVTDQNTENK